MRHSGQKKVPGPGFFSFISKVQANPVICFYNLMKKYGDVVRCPSLPDIYLVSSPSLAKKILIDSQKLFDKSDFISTRMKYVMGEGLVMSNGKKWKQQRKTAQLIMDKEHLQRLVPGIARCVNELIIQWKNKAGTGQPVNISRDIRGLVVRIMAQSFFPLGNEAVLRRFEAAFASGKRYVSHPLPFGLPAWVPLSRKARVNKALEEIGRIIGDMMEERPLTGKYEGRLLAHIMDQRDEAGKPLSKAEVIAEVKNLFASSYFSIADFMAWLIHLLAKHPDWAERIAAECSAGHTGVDPDFVETMPAMMQFIHEALRCYPPGWAVSRRALSAVELGGYTIPRHATVLVSIYNLHHDPELWEEPEEFIPGRFDRRRGIPEKAMYIPFGLGPRKCAGMALARMVIHIVCAGVVSHFRLLANEKIEPVIQSGISLGSQKDLELFLELR